MLDEEIGTVTVLDPEALSVKDTIRVGDDERDMMFGAGSVWLADGDAGSVTRIDPLTRDLTTFPVAGAALSVAVDPATGEVWSFVARRADAGG